MAGFIQENSMEQALIIFARIPEKGKVKTRLAAQIGAEGALAVYIRLLEHTRSLAKSFPCNPYVFLAGKQTDNFWNGFNTELQTDGDLGQKMLAAFQLLFEHGYKKVVIIGSDCPTLAHHHLATAFAALDEKDVVIGPATDGGYYLLGMKQLHAPIFFGKTWSTPAVLQETLETLDALQLTCHLLAPLTDVDEAADLPDAWKIMVL